ncbi:MAG: GNAT family N-acetyltransferase [Burkholderiales bacterium]|nr:GNAT family N-acetyltransferase [Burkholderiales bacterium]
MADETVRVVDDPASLDAQAWNRLARGHPFLRHEFFAALHETGCATARTGWTPQFLVLEREGVLAGAMPLYLKAHSYGEYVFDWAWADAYHRHGFEYYPKLLAAVPFSPVSAPKLLAADERAKRTLISAALRLARQASSLHVLFPTPEEARLLAESGCMLRRGVQFHWENRGYADFDAFLATLSHDKRKKIKQERRKVREAGVTLRRLVGTAIGPADWRFFARCYTNTYREHLSTPYLTRAFFERLGETLGENLLLVIAERDGRPIASALDVFTGETLYGRYWGSVEHVPALHFEACYYQAIEFAIERGIAVFEGGAQGEHKLARGFLPVETLSAHWLAHPEFADAVQRFLDRESAGIERYLDELNERAPFKRQE